MSDFHMPFPNSFKFISSVSDHDTNGSFYRGLWREREIATLRYSEPEMEDEFRHAFWDHLKSLFGREPLNNSGIVTVLASRRGQTRLRVEIREHLVLHLRRARAQFNEIPNVVTVHDMRIVLIGTTEVQELNLTNGTYSTCLTFAHENRYPISLVQGEEIEALLLDDDNADSDDDEDNLNLNLKGFVHHHNDPSPRGSHRLKISLDISVEWQTQEDVDAPPYKPSPKRIKIEDDDILDKMMADDGFKDFIVVADSGKEFKCHRVVLKARSDVLEALITSDMTEAKEGKLKVFGSSDEGLEQLLHYLYGKEISLDLMTPALALELLQHGDLYQLDDLVGRICSNLKRRDGNWFTDGEKDVEIILALFSFATKSDNAIKMNLGDYLMEIMAWLTPSLFTASPTFHKMTKQESNELLFKMLEIHTRNK